MSRHLITYRGTSCTSCCTASSRKPQCESTCKSRVLCSVNSDLVELLTADTDSAVAATNNDEIVTDLMTFFTEWLFSHFEFHYAPVRLAAHTRQLVCKPQTRGLQLLLTQSTASLHLRHFWDCEAADSRDFRDRSPNVLSRCTCSVRATAARWARSGRPPSPPRGGKERSSSALGGRPAMRS